MDTLKQCTLKVRFSSENVTKEELKAYFREKAGCETTPSVAIEKQGSAIVMFANAEDADLVLLSEHVINGEPITVAKMPPPYLSDTSVELSTVWEPTLRSREDVRRRLLDDHGISTAFLETKCVFRGNFYTIQNLHRLLDDMLPDGLVTCDTDSTQNGNDFEVIETTETEAMADYVGVDVIGLDNGSTLVASQIVSSIEDKEFSIIGDELYEAQTNGELVEGEIREEVRESNVTEVTAESAATTEFEESSLTGTQDVTNEDEKAFGDVVTASGDKTVAGEDEHAPNEGEDDQHVDEDTELVAVATIVPATGTFSASVSPGTCINPPSSMPGQTVVRVSAGVFQYIKDKRENDLKAMEDSFNVTTSRSSTEDKFVLKVKIRARDKSQPALLQEAQKRLELLCREVDLKVHKMAMPIEESVANSTELKRLTRDVINQFPDITLSQSASDILLVGEEGLVRQGSLHLKQGYEDILKKHRRAVSLQHQVEPSPIGGTPTPSPTITAGQTPTAACNGSGDRGTSDETDDLVQQLLDRGGASESVMNDIYSAREGGITHANGRQRSIDLLQIHDDEAQATAEGAGVGGPDDVNAIADSLTCSFCCEVAGDVAISKLVNCVHSLCDSCFEPAKAQGFCPLCEEPMRASSLPFGTQPKGGIMTEEAVKDKLPGYDIDSKGTIIITYDIPDGIQGPNHPNPGSPYAGTKRRSYLPDTTQGREVLRMFRMAFKQRLVFTIVESDGQQTRDRADWACGITHKTDCRHNKLSGYPDESYLDRVSEELAAFGITMDYLRQQYDARAASL